MVADRAKWTKEQEKALLDAFQEKRMNPSLKSDKGIKTKGWSEIVTSLNKSLGVNRDKGQYKSKLDRIMSDYDLFKSVANLSGVGICPTTGRPTMADDVWERLIESKPKDKKRLLEFKTVGFDHYIICSHIAGDARATGSGAVALGAVVAALDGAPDSTDCSTASSTVPTQHPSAEARKQNVKRIRDGAAAAKQKAKKLKDDDDEDKTAMMRAVTKYFTFKLERAIRLEESERLDDYVDTSFEPSSQ